MYRKIYRTGSCPTQRIHILAHKLGLEATAPALRRGARASFFQTGPGPGPDHSVGLDSCVFGEFLGFSPEKSRKSPLIAYAAGIFRLKESHGWVPASPGAPYKADVLED